VPNTMTREVIEDCQNLANQYKKIAQSIGQGGVRLATAGEYMEASLAIEILCTRLQRMTTRRYLEAKSHADDMEYMERWTKEAARRALADLERNKDNRKENATN